MVSHALNTHHPKAWPSLPSEENLPNATSFHIVIGRPALSCPTLEQGLKIAQSPSPMTYLLVSLLLPEWW